MRAGTVLIWAALACVVTVPLAIAATSPYLAGRTPVYVVAGFAGIAGLALLLIQPLLAARYLPGLRAARARRWHRWVGVSLVVAVMAHVGGLYLTSPADALDALLLVSPTPFSVYGVIGLWSVVLTALLVTMRGRIGPRPAVWKGVHNALAVVLVVASVVHALMIEGTMGAWSKWALCLAALTATLVAVVHLRVIVPLRKG